MSLERLKKTAGEPTGVLSRWVFTRDGFVHLADEIEALKARVEALEAEKTQVQPKRGPGRPRKDEAA